MNTNSNVYTVIYTTIVVVIVAAVLAFVSQKLGPMQADNAKAETLRQMMSAAGVKTNAELAGMKNAEVLQLYSDSVEEAFTVSLDGTRSGELRTAKDEIELIDALKAVNNEIKAGGCNRLPVYKFKGGISVIPVYGAGLWGPVWGYIAFEENGRTIRGAYFDHASETPGLGGKIKEDPSFREKFAGRELALEGEDIFVLAKNAEQSGAANAVDAITGATMTSKGLNAALNFWFGAYREYLSGCAVPCTECCEAEETVNAEEE